MRAVGDVGSTAARGEACEATLVRGEQSPELMDLRMLCLDRRRGELRALVRALAVELDPTKALDGAARLTPIASCADVTALSARVVIERSRNYRFEGYRHTDSAAELALHLLF